MDVLFDEFFQRGIGNVLEIILVGRLVGVFFVIIYVDYI